MKKFLSLVLALVMTMSLVTISAGAKEFADDDSITYDEAVNVISTIGVVDGYTDGKFNPTNTLTRQAAAKIICNLILGPTTAAELHADTAPFKDVPVTSEFAGYIAYCAKEGIISGYADGAFRPGNSLTGYAFMKMLLGALGYDAEIEGYTGANWSISVAKRAKDIGLDDSLVSEFNGIKAVTREEACLYAFNTLKADLVEYSTSLTVNSAGNLTGLATAKAQEWNNSATRHNNIKEDKYIQFAEQYFTKLVLATGNDAFGRPTRDWEYNGKDIGEYVNTDLLVESYSAKVTGKDLYELLGKSTVEDYSFSIYIDGETEKDILGSAYFTDDNIVKTNTEKVGATGNGVTTEVYEDIDHKEVTIAIINTYLAVADDDYNEKKEEVSLTVWGIDDVTTKGNYVKDTDEKSGFKVSNDDINVEDIEDEDIVLVTVAEGEIQSIAAPEVLEEVEISKFTKEKSVTTGGSDYKYADAAMYDDEVLDKYDQTNMKETSYNVYLDQYGYLIGIDIIEEASKYLFLTGMEGGTSNLNNKNVDANVIFLDGTMDVVSVNTTKSTGISSTSLANTWCTYSVDKNGVYTLTAVKSTTFDDTKDKVGQSVKQQNSDSPAAPALIDKKHVTLPGNGNFKQVYGNDSSVYITVDTKVITATAGGDGNNHAIIISDVDSVSVGVQSTSIQPFSAATVQNKHLDAAKTPIVTDATNTSHGVYTLFKNNGYVIGAIVVGEDEGNTTNYAYVISDDVDVESYDKGSEEWTWTREVVIDGVVTELTEVGETLSEIGEDDMDQGKWYEVKFYADGTVRRATEVLFANVAGKFVDSISLVEASVEDNNPVVLFADLRTTNNTLSVKGNTLQVNNKSGYVTDGFGVAADAKIVLVQDKYVTGTGKVSEMSYVDEYDNGTKGLEKVISYLNANEAFKGYVSAVFENGIATSVVIYDTTATEVDTGSIKTDAGLVVDLTDPTSVGVTYYADGDTTTSETIELDDILSTIEQELIAAGNTINSKNKYGASYSFRVTMPNGFEETYTYTATTPDELVKVKLDSSAVELDTALAATPFKATAKLDKASITSSDSVKVTVTVTTAYGFGTARYVVIEDTNGTQIAKSLTAELDNTKGVGDTVDVTISANDITEDTTLVVKTSMT